MDPLTTSGTLSIEEAESNAVRSPTLGLKARYVVALSLVAALVVAGQVLVQVSLTRQEKDSRTINVAGRQRMLSQRISKCALSLRNGSGSALLRAKACDLSRDLALWRRSHAGLLKGDDELGLSGDNSPAVLRLYEELQPAFAAMSSAAGKLAAAVERGDLTGEDADRYAATILENEGRFVDTMDEIVFAYDSEAKARVTGLRRVEIGLTAAALLVLLLEALFIFRPAVKRLRRTLKSLVLAKRDFEELSQLDGLTGISNRRYFDSYLAQECRRAGRDSRSLSVILIDVDHFKQYNETFGHQRGDECLRRVARALTAQAKRPGDMVARYGGDEFVAVLPDTDLAGAVNVASAMKNAIKFLGIEHAHPGIERRLTVSLGVAVGLPSPAGFGPDSFLSAADDALFRAKRKSRDVIVTVELEEQGVGGVEVAGEGAIGS